MTWYELHLKEPWFSLIESGKKRFEGRANIKPFNQIKKGDYIKFILEDDLGDELDDEINVIVDDTPIIYESFEAFLDSAPLEIMVPGKSNIEDARKVYSGLLKARKTEIEKHGMIAIPIHVV